MHRSTAWETALTIQPALPFPELDPLTAHLPLSVWTTGQQDSRTQRRGRYLAASMAHPGKMLPAIARHAIEHYTSPDDLVIDPIVRHRHHPGGGDPRGSRRDRRGV